MRLQNELIKNKSHLQCTMANKAWAWVLALESMTIPNCNRHSKRIFHSCAVCYSIFRLVMVHSRVMDLQLWLQLSTNNWKIILKSTPPPPPHPLSLRMRLMRECESVCEGERGGRWMDGWRWITSEGWSYSRKTEHFLMVKAASCITSWVFGLRSSFWISYILDSYSPAVWENMYWLQLSD